MCLVVPPKKGSKGHKSAKSKSTPQAKPTAVPAIPTYSRMPQSKTCISPAASPVCQTECLLDFLKERYPGDSSAWEQYSHSLGLRHLDERVHTQFDQAKSATENVEKGVKAIQERLDQMGETLKGTDEAAKAARDFGQETKKRRSAKADEQRNMREEAAKSELERLKGLIVKQEKENEERKNKQAQKKGLDEADVLKLVDERDMRRELERLRGLQEGAAPEHDKDCLREVDLVKILDQRDHEREHARLQALASQRAADVKQDDVQLQEARFREVLEEHEQRKEFERLKAFEAEALRHGTGGHLRPGDTATVSLAEIERVIEEILMRHDLARRFEEGHDTLGPGQRRETSPAPAPNREAETQRTIDQVLETLLQRRHTDKATELLERLLYKTEHDSHSDRHWILTEVLGYIEEYLLPEQRYGESARPGFYHRHPLDDMNFGFGSRLLKIASPVPVPVPVPVRQAAGSRCALGLES
ncbi:hypothetical protein LA080_015497 [Diaporthe eres]|nr:hypothetical protein LA080_015497 [Diaporthe eres]